jgi:hypothetical protein
MSTVSFPKIKYPIDTRLMTPEDRRQVLAYDLIWKWLEHASIVHLPDIEGMTLLNDTAANLNGLGSYLLTKFGEELFEPGSIVEDGTTFTANASPGRAGVQAQSK